MRIPEETIAKIKNETDITELVASYIKLERRGRNYVGLCPFHDEKTPSFSVSPENRLHTVSAVRKAVTYSSSLWKLRVCHSLKRLPNSENR